MSGWPTPRHVELDATTARQVADAFDLGTVSAVALAARGWVSLNVTWRIDTATGVWAVKEVAREPRPQLEAAARIERTAARAGIAVPAVVPTASGEVTAEVGGRVFRCHEFVNGERPTDDLREADAAAAGAALGRLHLADVPWDPILMTRTVFGEAHWRDLVERGDRIGASWVGALRDALPAIGSAERAAAEWSRTPHRWVGSHRDVRPDNALRTRDGLLLVDWDGAGPVVPGREVSGARTWWRPHDDVFLDAYLEVAGDVDLAEGSGEDGGLVWWLETNVRHALALPGDEEREWAVGALAANVRRSTA